MTDISEKSESINNDKISLETRINSQKYQNNSGDGPQIAYPYCELNQLSLRELSTDEQKNQHRNTDVAGKSLNNMEDNKNMEGYHKKSLKDDCSNKTFLVSFCNLTILDVLKNVQSTINNLKISNFSDKNQISMHLDELNSSKLAFIYLKEAKSSTHTKNSSYDTEIQRLQMLLLYVLEQLTHLSGSLIDTQMHLEKLLMFRQEEDVENNTINDCNFMKSNNESFKISNRHSEGEDDIFSVEELSWDEHQLSNQKLDQINNFDQKLDCHNMLNFEHTKSTVHQNTQENLRSKIVCSSDYNHDESIEEISLKSHKSKPATSPQNEEMVKSNSFHEIKSKFEKLKVSPTLTNKKDLSISPSFRSDKDILSSKKSSGIIFKSRISKDDHEILSKKCDDDCVDNSAFLVSSIDSFTESISFTNPNNNNNRFSDRYKTNISNIIDTKTTIPSVAIDVVAENLSVTTDLPKDMYNKSSHNNKVDHYIEVVSNINLSNQPVYIDSPYINYHKKDESKSLTSSSEHIIALGKLDTKSDQINKNKTDSDKDFSIVILLMKELVDSEKNYVNGLFIYSQVLYNRIKLSNIISHRNLNIMFPNCIHRIYKFHTDFLNQLNNIFQKSMKFESNNNLIKQNHDENKMQTVKFGQVFLENLENDNWKFFSLYRQFYLKSQTAITIFNKLKKNSPKFERLIKILKHSEHCNHLELGAFIMIPLQRLSKYLTILRRILGNLAATQIDEKIPILAIEHLLAGFITEMDDNQNNLGFIKNNSKTLDSSADFSNNSLKLNSLYDLPIKDSATKSQDYEKKNEKLHKAVSFDYIKKFWSQSVLMNNANKDSCQILNSDTQCASISVEGQSFKNQLYVSNSMEKNSTSDLPETSDKLKVDYKLKLKVIENCKNSKSLDEYKSCLKPSANQEKTENEINVLRSQSVPLHLKLKNPKKPISCNKNNFDAESILSQATEECSVCVHSQDECEIDTSMEDDKTCIADVENNTKIKEKHQLEKSTTHSSAFLISNVKSYITEFVSEHNTKVSDLNCSALSDKNKANSIKGFLSDQIKFFMLNNLLKSESDSLINRKVDNIVLILCHVVFETMIQIYENPNNKIISNDLKRIETLIKPLEPDLEEYKYSSYEKVLPDISDEFANNLEKKETKKFSIKHLFSLRRKNRIDRNSQQEHLSKGTVLNQFDKRSNSRCSMQKNPC